MSLLSSIQTHQFHYQMEGRPHFLENVSSYRVKFISKTVVIVEIKQGSNIVTLSLPTNCVWRTSAEDKTDWSKLND